MSDRQRESIDPWISFRDVPRTGVIYVSEEAKKYGYRRDAKGWCNLGQGQPDTDALEGAPARIERH